MSTVRSLAIVIAALVPACVCQAQDNNPDFYRGKTVRLIVGAAAGGGYDIPARVLASHMARHIPGSPTIVVENMPGATGLIMANYLYRIAPKDGSVIGMATNNVPVETRLKLMSKDGGNVAFDAENFSWIGSPIEDPQVFFTLSSAANSIEMLKSRKVIVGSTGPTADNYSSPQLLKRLIGANIDIVTGYQGQNEIFTAIERGEVQGNSTGSTNVFVTKADWLRDGKITLLVQFGSKRARSMPNIPTAIELADNAGAREMLRIFGLKYKIARPLLAPPGIPAPQLAQLRQAFDDTMRDPAFLAQAKAISIDISPVSGAEIVRLLRDLHDTPDSVVDQLRQTLSGR
jgi:tripartite-type tricarboxylate transporter receptor subunit TctC